MHNISTSCACTQQRVTLNYTLPSKVYGMVSCRGTNTINKSINTRKYSTLLKKKKEH